MVRCELPNGLRIIVKRNPLSPAVAVRLCLHSGTVQDPAGREGAALATSIVIEEGTGKRTGRQIADMIDFIGAEIGTTVDRHSTMLLGSMMRGDLESILKPKSLSVSGDFNPRGNVKTVVTVSSKQQKK